MSHSPPPALPPLSADAAAQYNAGQRCLQQKNLPAALKHFQSAVKIAGEHPLLLDALATVAETGGDLAAAVRIVSVLRQRLPSPRMDERLARLLYRRQQYRETLPLFDGLLTRDASRVDLAVLFSSALEMSGDFQRARDVREAAFAKVPSAKEAADLATMYMRHADYARLRERLPTLLAQYPQEPALAVTAAVWHLGAGDYPQGLAFLRQRQNQLGVDHDDPRVRATPLWDGTVFDGTLLVSLEPQLGDEIVMTSLLPQLLATGQKTVVEIDARCEALFVRSFPGFTFVSRSSRALGDLAAQGGCRHALTLDLLQVLQRQWTLPGTKGWLRPNAELVERKRAEYHARWPGKKLIGISWRSKQHYNGVDAKSAALTDFMKTLALPDTVFINLQYGDTTADVAALPENLRPWRDPEIDPFNDIDDLAAQLCALDRMVSVSSATAHLAGALGVPTTVLLPKRFPVLWHWGFLGNETTWYDSVRTLRNRDDSGWQSLDGIVAADIAGPGAHAGPDSRLR